MDGRLVADQSEVYGRRGLGGAGDEQPAGKAGGLLPQSAHAVYPWPWQHCECQLRTGENIVSTTSVCATQRVCSDYSYSSVFLLQILFPPLQIVCSPT